MPSMNVVLPAPFGPMRPTRLRLLHDEVDLVDGPQPAERHGHVGGGEERHQRPPTPAATGSGSAGACGGSLDRRPKEVPDLLGREAEGAGQPLRVLDGVEDEPDAADERDVLGRQVEPLLERGEHDAVRRQAPASIAPITLEIPPR